VNGDLVVHEVDFRKDGAQVEVDVRRAGIVGRDRRKDEMLVIGVRLLLLMLLTMKHLRVAAAFRRAAHVVALMHVVVFRLRLLLLLLGVDRHGRL